MLEVGGEEKKLAEDRGDYHQGVPAVTVIVDGGWSKISHKHSYNAKSGVAIVIGQATTTHRSAQEILHCLCSRHFERCTYLLQELEWFVI